MNKINRKLISEWHKTDRYLKSERVEYYEDYTKDEVEKRYPEINKDTIPDNVNTRKEGIPWYEINIQNKGMNIERSNASAMLAYCDGTFCTKKQNNCNSSKELKEIYNLSEEQIEKALHKLYTPKTVEACISPDHLNLRCQTQTITSEEETTKNIYTNVDEHTKKIHQFLTLLSDFGLKAVAAIGEKSKLEKLPKIKNYSKDTIGYSNINPDLNKIISNYDCQGLKDENKLKVIGEVEDSTNIEHSIVKFKELIMEEPIIDFKIYIIASDSDKKRKLVIKNLKRKQFETLKIRYISYSKLDEALKIPKEYRQHFRPSFLDAISESLEEMNDENCGHPVIRML